MGIGIRKSKPLQTMKSRSMNHKKSFGGSKPIPKFKNIRSVKGLRKGIRIIKKIKRDF